MQNTHYFITKSFEYFLSFVILVTLSQYLMHLAYVCTHSGYLEATAE